MNSSLQPAQNLRIEKQIHSRPVGSQRVAVDATCWQNTRGYGRHARNLLSALTRIDQENHYVFIVDSQEALDLIPSNVEPVLVNTGKPTALAAASDGRRALFDMWRMSRAFSQPDFDLVLFPTVYSYVPVFSRAHKMVFIHDVIAEKYPDLTLPSLPARLAWSAKVGLALRQARTIVTVSEHSKLGIIDVFKVPDQNVKVIGEAPSPIFKKLEQLGRISRLTGRIPGKGRRVVYVGGFGPHKNLTRLVEVFARLTVRSEFADLSLILVGEYQSEVFYSVYTELRRQIVALGIEQRVVFTGYLPDEDLVILLNQADVLVLPSLLEGYGLPAVEAAACGCPVVATKSSPLPDLLGEGGLYFDPLNSHELEEALMQVLCSRPLREKMSNAGLKAAERLSWDQAALALKELIESIKPL
jgi:glycosyltransferase involved in cell wall biosynthesis